MMTDANFFDRLDQDALERATKQFALPLIIAGGSAGTALAHDPAVPPVIIVAAMVRGHAQGLASALAGAARLGGNDATQTALLQEDLLAAAIAEIRASLVHAFPNMETIQ